MYIIEAKSLTKHYGERENIVKAVDNVNIQIKKGEFASILGASGSGKTTFLNLIAGLDKATSGEIIVAGVPLSKLKGDDLTLFRRKKIGFIFQNLNLVPILSVYENIILPSRLDRTNIDESFLREIIQKLGIAQKINNMPNTLSGGQQQRVAIARAIINKVDLIIADEPTGSLDSKAGEDVMQLLQQANKEWGQTIVMVTHNETFANKAQHIIYMQDGKIVDEVKKYENEINA
ncbi:MAG: ABC transporter ATP-binding protein [Epulopiscium sp. Nele67-Bin005]|nr:MAG: ABC transporter ATP-binding protein [Epulopiscium sp. Nele67-Bin005]